MCMLDLKKSFTTEVVGVSISVAKKREKERKKKNPSTCSFFMANISYVLSPFSFDHTNSNSINTMSLRIQF